MQTDYAEEKHKYMKNNMQWSSHFIFSQVIQLPSYLPDIGHIVSSLTEPEIMSIKTIRTCHGKSYEGQYLTGKIAIVKIKLKNKTLFASCLKTKSLHIVKSFFLRFVHLVIPCLIEGTDPEKLFRTGNLKIKIIFDSDFNMRRDRRCFYKRMSLTIKIYHIPVKQNTP